MQLLIDNPVLLLVAVMAVGYALGRVKVFGISLGVSAVLFVGLAFGALHPDMKLPEIVYTLGLVLFVYTVGLSSGRGFFASLRSRGLRYNLLVVVMIAVAVAIALAAALLLKLRPAIAAGLFAGSLTNTPALAAVVDYVKMVAPAAQLDRIAAEPVIGYAVAYPMGVVAMILAISLAQQFWRIDYAAESEKTPEFTVPRPLFARTIRVDRADATQLPIRDLISQSHWKIVFARLKRGGEVLLVRGDVRLQEGDLVSVVGCEEDLETVTSRLGEALERRLDFDRSELDYQRMFISNHHLVGRRLRELHLIRDHEAVVTRIRRGDSEIVPDGETTLELGDQVQVLAHRTRLGGLRKVFGDSYRELSEIDVFTFSLGIALGLLLGSVPIPLPGGIVFKLGFAGGPLIVALVLGAVGRTRRLVWTLPYSANLTIRQIGLLLFLAGIGTRSGYSFVSTLAQGGGLAIFLVGLLITTVVSVGTLTIGYKMLGVPMPVLTGMLAGLQTQPAVLGFSLEQSRNDLPNIGYATVYPMAMVAKILFAQFILALLLTSGS